MLHHRAAGLALAVLLVIVPAFAWAQAATPPVVSTAIDFNPLITELIKLLGGVLATIISIKIARWFGLKSENEIRMYIEPALQNALAYGQARVGLNPVTLDAKNAIVAEAANFAITHVGDGLRKLKISDDAVARMLMARLEANISAQLPEVTATASAPMPTLVAKSPDPPPAGA